MRKGHRLRRIAGALVLIAAGISPFAVYIALKVTETTPPPAWPADVAVATAEGGSLRSLALLHFLSPTEAMIVRFPIETTFSVPAAGTLRALTAYGIGGVPMLARALEQTAGVEVPFWAEWTRGAAAGRAPDRSNLSEHAQFVVDLIASPATTLATAPGAIAVRSGVSYYELDRTRLRILLGGVALDPTPVATTSSPTPSPSPSPSPSVEQVSIQVLNQGGAAGAAAEVATALQQAGYLDVRTGNSTRRAITGVVVYYKASRTAGEAVARVIGPSVVDVAELPRSLSTTADILVLVGRETTTSTQANRPATTTTPTPSESAVVVP